MWPILIIAAAYLGYNYYHNSQLFIDKYKFIFDSAAIDAAETEKQGYKKLGYKVTFYIDNPTDFSTTLKNIHLNFIFKGNTVATVTKNEMITIPAHAKPKFTVSTVVDPINIGLSVAELLAQPQLQKLQYTITGTADFPLGQLKINETITAF